MNPRVLIIDDEQQIRRLVRMVLLKDSWQVSEASEGMPGLSEAVRVRPEVIILDLGLPDINGIDVLRRLREWTDVPVLILSISERDSDKIAALEAGADDYLTKPFSEKELLARLRVLMRHRRKGDKTSLIRIGSIDIDLASRCVLKNGIEKKLTETEYALLSLLAVNRGKVMTQNEILRALWGPNAENRAQYLRVYVNRLRRKLEDHPNSPFYLRTEAGIGYRFDDTPI